MSEGERRICKSKLYVVGVRGWISVSVKMEH